MTVRVAAVGQAHAAVLAALHDTCFDDPWGADAFCDLLALPTSLGYIATGDNDAPLGFVLFSRAADEAEILTIGVLPSHRNQGIARALLDTGLADLVSTDVSAVFLEVATDNPAARAFYRAAGFTDVGRRKGYYKRATGRVDALVLRRSLSPTS